MQTKTASKSNKTHFAFPRKLLEEIDEIAGKRKRSAFMVAAAREKLERERFERVLRSAAGAWTDKNHPDLKTKKDVDSYVRKLRKSSDKRLKHIYG